ncbi:MAG: hypothetical protein ACJAZX_000473 [Rickettsiales bacterium]
MEGHIVVIASFAGVPSLTKKHLIENHIPSLDPVLSLLNSAYLSEYIKKSDHVEMDPNLARLVKEVKDSTYSIPSSEKEGVLGGNLLDLIEEHKKDVILFGNDANDQFFMEKLENNIADLRINLVDASMPKCRKFFDAKNRRNPHKGIKNPISSFKRFPKKEGKPKTSLQSSSNNFQIFCKALTSCFQSRT